MRNPFLIGEAIYLRPLAMEDAATITSWFNDPEVVRYTLRYRPMMLMEEEAFIRSLPDKEDVVFGVVLREEDRLVGVTGLHDFDQRNRHAGFGIILGDRSLWGRGLGTEATRLVVGYAFETLNLERVWLHVYEYNERGVGAYEKVGFRLEGRLRRDTWRHGRYWDTLVMGILRDEWVGEQKDKI